MKICGENDILDQPSEIIELSLTGHFDHGEVIKCGKGLFKID